MKKLSLIFTAFIFVLSLASIALADMTADEIITKHLEMTGGLDNYKNLKSIEYSGKAFAQQMSFDVLMANETPNKYAMKWSSEMANVEMGSDGKENWALYPGVPGYIMTDEEDLAAALESHLITPFLDYKERGATAKLVGDEQVKGAEAYKIEYVTATGDTTYQYFDKSNFNLLKQSSAEGEVVFSKFKKVGDFTLAHTMNIYEGGQTIMMVFKDVTINGDIDESLFTAPADSLRASPEIMEQIKKAMEAQKAQQQKEEPKSEAPAETPSEGE